ncbi:hypothetical protein GF327_00625, partial [Candidatus Woesearchaeota archaeon]|nr:hypothetical protein [Candidatus Woesearchaeota archaeon]
PSLNLTNEKKGIIKTTYTTSNKGKPFWKTLSENNIPCTVVRWPVTFPAEKINGRMLSGLGVVDIKGMLNSYSFYTDENIEGDNVVNVKKTGQKIITYISGPMIRKKGELKDIRVDMEIECFDDYAKIMFDGQEIKLKKGKWSEMLRIEFKIYIMKIKGIFKLHLESFSPFKMYMTSIQIDPKDPVHQISYPKDYAKELADNISLYYTLGMPADTKAVKQGNLSKKVFLEQVKEIENEREKMFWFEFERFNKGVFAFVFDSGDRLKHIFWDNESEKIPDEIKEYYLDKDRFIGEIIKKIDDGTKLIILSDHGFSDFTKKVNINNWLIEKGYMKTNQKQGSLLRFVDWEKTKAYSYGFTSIYLNLKTREKQGIVENKNKVADSIIKDLNELKDKDKKVLTDVYKGEEIYSGEFNDDAPDIVLGFNRGYRMSDKSAIGELDEKVITENTDEWSGDHLMDRSHVPGVLFTNFNIKKKNPELIDIAPTILKLSSISADNMDGEELL